MDASRIPMLLGERAYLVSIREWEYKVSIREIENLVSDEKEYMLSSRETKRASIVLYNTKQYI